MDSTTRRLRAFSALADTLHFGRAAARVHVTQQALSKQIAALEAELGMHLVQRTTRAVTLTPAGALFAETCRRTLTEFDQGLEAVRRDPGTLQLGLVVLGALELTQPLQDEFRRAHPASEVVTRQFTFADPSAGLAEGWSDLAVVRLPIDVPGLASQRLFTEPRVVAVPTGHRLAAATSVNVEDLLEETITVSTAPGDRYRRFWSLADHRASPMPPPIVVRTHAEEIARVASGRALSITSASAARITPAPGVVYVPIEDIARTECALAWRGERTGALVQGFVEAARRVIERETDLIRRIEHPDLSGATPCAG